MFIYLFQNSCIRPVALSCKRLCFISGMDVINDLCIYVLHLKLWMLALIQGLALQSQGSFFLYKGGILHLFGKDDVGWLWHRRLAHVNMRTLKSLYKKGHIVGLKENVSFAKDCVCRACVQGKMHDAPHKPKNRIKSTRILELLHVDLFGPPSHARWEEILFGDC